MKGRLVKTPDEIKQMIAAGDRTLAISQTGTLTETPFCIRQLEQEKIIKEMIG